jgi:RNA polymerase sigma factor (sigma-70 family)
MEISRSLTDTVASGWVAPRSRADVTGADVQTARTAEEQVTVYFLEHSEAVYRYLVCVFRSESDAEEVTQEAFLRLYRTLDAKDRIENPKAWVLTVARRLMLDRLKHQRYETPKLCELTDAVGELVPDPGPTPEEVLLDRTRRQALDAAIHDLTDLQKHCLHLRSEGLRLRQIGEVVHLDLRRVAEVIQRAIVTLQRRVGV